MTSTPVEGRTWRQVGTMIAFWQVVVALVEARLEERRRIVS